MPHPTSRPRQSLLAYAYLTPFGALALYGLAALTGWWTGHLTLIQPRSYDPALSANACFSFFLIGLAPIALALGWRRAALGAGLVAAVIAWATLIQSPLGLDLCIYHLLGRHQSSIARTMVARLTAALAGVIISC